MSNEKKHATIQERVKLAAEDARQVMKTALPGAEGVVSRPYAIAEMLQQSPGESGTLSVAFEKMVGAYYATALGPRISEYLAVHTMLSERGYVSESDRLRTGMNDFLWAVPARNVESAPDDVDAEPVAALALVLETPSRCFIIVFNYDFAWSMHIRQYWRAIQDVPGSALHRQKTRALSAEELVVMSSDAVDFSDDVPGAAFLRRPSLETYLNGTLLVGRDDSSAGLRYGDCRDPGYIVSVKETGVVGLPTVEDGMQVPYNILAYVINFLTYAGKLQQGLVKLD